MDHENGIGHAVIGREIEQRAHDGLERDCVDFGGEFGTGPGFGRPRGRGRLRRQGWKIDHRARPWVRDPPV